MSIPPPGTPIILDIGSAYVKTGFAGESKPRFIFPTVIGTQKYQQTMVDTQARDVYVGEGAMKMRGVLNLTHPIERSAICDWDNYYQILNHVFYNLLRIDNPQNYPIIYIESVSEQQDVREFIARVLFETHQFQKIMLMPSPILSCFAVGLTTGLVIEVGAGLTWIVPIINGQIIYRAIQRLDLAGVDINHNLKALLMRRGINISSSAAEEILQEIKEKYCYFVLDPDNPTNVKESIQHPLPDGSMINIPAETLYEACEVLYQPSMIGSNSANLPDAIITSLNMIDKAYWGDLLTHIVLSGGTCIHTGFKERLQFELNNRLSQFDFQIPRPSLKDTEIEVKTLKPVQGNKQKKQDNCPKCGAILDLSDGKRTCPKCGANLEIKQIDISLDGSKTIMCPLCNKEIDDASSLFCPYCGYKLKEPEPEKEEQTKPNSTPELEPEKEPEKEPEPEIKPPPPETSEYFEGTQNFLKFFVPDNLQLSIFNGAAILGSLPSFKQLFITQEQFQANRNILSRDISEIFTLNF
ncbi:MAG: zinc-ribbon domain-containing protein [Promethearchaeota archaeon]|nr:MAG: zinc-ribbon domain-containing protein [Candidatus Lokiarchaeota archaeon]